MTRGEEGVGEAFSRGGREGLIQGKVQTEAITIKELARSVNQTEYYGSFLYIDA